MITDQARRMGRSHSARPPGAPGRCAGGPGGGNRMGTKTMGTQTSGETRGARAAAALGDPSSRAVLDGIRAIVRALRESSRQAERVVGLSAAQLFVLQRLAGARALSLGELA